MLILFKVCRYTVHRMHASYNYCVTLMLCSHCSGLRSESYYKLDALPYEHFHALLFNTARHSVCGRSARK